MSASAQAAEPVGRRLVAADAVPPWLRPLVERIDGGTFPAGYRQAGLGRPAGARRGAVLMLLADGSPSPDLLLTARAATLRSHAGQPAFPGGGVEPGEDAVAAALREGEEETGLDPSSINPLAVLPPLYLPPSDYLVEPVLAHWHTPGPVRVVDIAETAAVVRVPVADLADPANRGTVRSPRGGYRGPAFTVAGLVIWGFTGGLVDLLLTWAGWSRPWDPNRDIPLAPWPA